MDSSAGRRCREAPWNRFLLALIDIVAVRAVAYRRQAAYVAAERPCLRQAGKTSSFYPAGAHIAGGRAARLAGICKWLSSLSARWHAASLAQCTCALVKQETLALFDFGLSVKSGPDPVLLDVTPAQERILAAGMWPLWCYRMHAWLSDISARET